LIAAGEQETLIMTRLNEELSSYREQSAVRRPDLAAAYDRLVRRLSALDRGEIGPRIGERMLPFALPDANGHVITLDSLLQSGPAVLSFNRGHWCPYCKIDLRSLATHHDRIKRLGASVVSIMPDSARFTSDYAKDNKLPFPVLSDVDLGYSLALDLIFWVGGEIQRLYQEAGILLDTYHGNEAYFLPIVAKIIVGQDGLVKAREVNLEFRARMEPEAIIEVFEQLRTHRQLTA
jgi:peroxiredoxin